MEMAAEVARFGAFSPGDAEAPQVQIPPQAPALRPEAVLSVSVNNGGHGQASALPVVADHVRILRPRVAHGRLMPHER